MRCYLLYAGSPHDEPIPFRSMSEAKDDFWVTAKELDRYGQAITASLHIAPTLLQMSEYPDYVLSLGPRGGLKVESA